MSLASLVNLTCNVNTLHTRTAGQRYRFFVVLRRPLGMANGMDMVLAMMDGEGRGAGDGGFAGESV